MHHTSNVSCIGSIPIGETKNQQVVYRLVYIVFLSLAISGALYVSRVGLLSMPIKKEKKKNEKKKEPKKKRKKKKRKKIPEGYPTFGWMY